jgi:hypothetical protein
MLANRTRENLKRNIEKTIHNPLGVVRIAKECYGGGEPLQNPAIDEYEREQMLVTSGVWRGPPSGYQLNERHVARLNSTFPKQKPPRPYLVDFARTPRETFKHTYVGSASTNAPGQYSRHLMGEKYTTAGNRDGEAEMND